MHTLKKVQNLPISLDEAWDFFSTPVNLKDITPEYMGFHILSEVPEKMYPGLIISYIVKPILNIPLRWHTEITHIKEKEYFVDFQISGPYKIWHHQHHFRSIEGGVEMVDLLSYELPLGFIGKIARGLFVGKKVEQIFDYRYKVLEEKFGKME